MCNRLKYNSNSTKLILIHRLFKERDDLLRSRIRCNVPVFRCSSQYKVSDGSTDDICLETGTFKSLGYMCNIRGDYGRIY